jgi:hypothetical protein
MALTIESQPAANSFHFASDPLIIKVSSDVTTGDLFNATALASITIDGVTYFSAKLLAVGSYNVVGPVYEYEFNFKKALTDIFKMIYPDVPDAELSALLNLQKNIGQVSITIDEITGDPAGVTDSVSTNTFYAVRGGTSWEQFPTLEFFDTYLPGNKMFLTWETSPVKIRHDLPYFLSFFQPYGESTWTVEIKSYDSAGTLIGTLSAFTNTAGPYTGIYCIPVGFVASGLSAEAYAANIARYTVQVKNGATLYTESILFLLDRSYRRYQRQFMYVNSLGGISCFTTNGESETGLQTTELNVNRYLPGEYDESQGQSHTIDVSMKSNIKVSSGFTTKARMKEHSEILSSLYVWELLTFPVFSDQVRKWIPIRRNGGNIRLSKDNEFMSVLQMEYSYAISNTHFTPIR